MIVLDGYESHFSAVFNEYYIENKIIIICLFTHSSHITQPLDIGCFNVLKRIYSCQLKVFIWAHINHIIKSEFFIAFVAVYNTTMKPENIKVGFRGVGLMPYDPEAVLSKIDIKLRTSTPTGPSADGSPWVSQTPYTAAEAFSQSQLVRGRIENHQGSSPTTLFQVVKQLAKGIEAIVYEMTFLQSDFKATQKANKVLAKR